MLRHSFVILVSSFVIPALALGDEPIAAPRPEAFIRSSRVESELPWLDSLAEAYIEAQRQGRPILARAGGESCPWCRVLEREIATPAAQQELARWTRVAIDVDEAPDDARRLAVAGIPALRVLTSTGKLVASTEGAMPAAELTRWLDEHYEAAASGVPPALLETGPLDAVAVRRLIRQFADRDATLREAAIRRLLPSPELAAAPVVETFRNGRLAARLTALELLREWEAPIESLDPWRPDTITDTRLEGLAEWAADVGALATDESTEPLTPDELAAARDAIDKLLAADSAEARALRERLARFGKRLLPEVYTRLAEVETDADRERLTALRYRLVASDVLVLNWPGGLERLAATELEIRQRAADELAARATPADEPLLLELFSDPAPLVREISLKALTQVLASGASDALVRLLDDPDPNVRAAVLKQLSEEPPPSVIPRVAEYVARESDADLVVHATRLLRQAKTAEAIAALESLLKHESWRVRAEAAEAIGESLAEHTGSGLSHSMPEQAAEKIAAEKTLIEVLSDPDGFVVSRAVGALSQTSRADAVDPLAAAATAHPEVARPAVQTLTNGKLPQGQVVPHLQRFAGHERPEVRAAAIDGLCRLLSDEAQEELATALRDPSSMVRIAAAEAFFELLSAGKFATGFAVHEAEGFLVEDTAPSGLLGGILQLFGSQQNPSPAKVTAKPAPEAAHAIRRVDPAAPVRAPVPGDEIAETDADRHLERIRAGGVFEPWQRQTGDLLLPLLNAEDVDERLAAALPLAALGRDAEAVPALSQIAEAAPRRGTKIAAALPWLLWPDRKALFDQLARAAATADELGAIGQSLVEIPEDRAFAELWELLGGDDIDATRAEALREALVHGYFPSNSWNIGQAEEREKARAVQAVLTWAHSGTHWQRMTAFSFLLRLRPHAVAAEIARPLYEAEATSPDLRVHAFQVLLLAESKSDATREAIAMLTATDAGLRRRALEFLCLGTEPLTTLDSGRFSLTDTVDHVSGFGSTGAEAAMIEPPAGLRADPLLPLLRSGDPREAARAGYLLVLLDRPEGLPPLLDYWQQHASQDDGWRRLVYRAIAFLDDSTRIPVLEEIYAELGRESYPNYQEFYWTIRIMTGSEVLALRKRIRDEVGMDQLR